MLTMKWYSQRSRVFKNYVYDVFLEAMGRTGEQQNTLFTNKKVCYLRKLLRFNDNIQHTETLNYCWLFREFLVNLRDRIGTLCSRDSILSVCLVKVEKEVSYDTLNNYLV